MASAVRVRTVGMPPACHAFETAAAGRAHEWVVMRMEKRDDR